MQQINKDEHVISTVPSPVHPHAFGDVEQTMLDSSFQMNAEVTAYTILEKYFLPS